jgi:hypothetical protein
MNAPFSAMGRPEPQILVFTPAMRTLIADAIESLKLLLDEIDGDPDLEEDPDFEEGPTWSRRSAPPPESIKLTPGKTPAARLTPSTTRRARARCGLGDALSAGV